MEDYHSDRLEYLENLARIAQMLLVLPLTPTEWTALDDLPRFLREVHHEASTDDHVLTPAERLTAGERRFRDAYGRDPLPLTARLKRYAQDAFRAEKRTAVGRKRALHKGLAHPKLSVPAVYARTNRLRQAGRLPKHSKPRAFNRPPISTMFAFDHRQKLL